ncbi:hypothetical protein Patl1_21564 [Pistacia atlantica]|uniref:Uncharacterized protein n=1 Tax=Pistacia atlantica TaxID=434234 RepID=A0ACC1BJ43_9ROSI|nr:hypothetical protein Patl1_21564 [Pistacia atlantica]
MMKEESNNDGGGNRWARVCDTCRAAACTVYCKADMAYLCAGPMRRRFALRVMLISTQPTRWRAVTSVSPFSPSRAQPTGRGRTGPTEQERLFGQEGDDDDDDDDDEEEAASWLLLNNPATARNGGNNNNNSNNNNNNGFLFVGEVDEYLDLVDYNGETQYVDQYNNNNQQQQQQQYSFAQKGYVGDSVVPHVQCEVKDQQRHHNNDFQLGLDYESSKATYSYNGSISHSVSISSTDLGVVPESTSDISISHSRPPKGTIDLFSGPPIQMPPQLTPMDREARVLRYREKKKSRKFEKTIRYASRKAYAETRPRIKGRFAKRTDVEVEVDQVFSTTLLTETGYGIVPSF